MKILISAISAKMGGAANYMKEIAAQFAARNSHDELTFLVPPEIAPAIQQILPHAEVVTPDIARRGFLSRIWFDQVILPRMLRERRIDALFSSADFGVLKSPCRQVLLVRNSIYFFAIYLEKYGRGRPLKSRVMDRFRRWLVCQSVRAADIVMTPSRAMLDELKTWIPVPDSKGLANPYGVNHAKFLPQECNLHKRGPWRLLFVSLYTDHKNLNTLLLAMKILVTDGVDVQLSTTADPNWPAARVTQSWRDDSQLAASPVLKGRINFVLRDPATAPENLYSECDIFVYPSVVESFGHALVEAMSSALPIVAADVPINRELCENAALYFKPFDPQDLAAQIKTLIHEPMLRKQFGEAALERSTVFNWGRHADTLISCLSAGLEPVQAGSTRQGV